MGVSVITIIGKGKHSDNSYEKTGYVFPGEDEKNARKGTMFSKALMDYYHDKKELESITIVGTETSTWSAILFDEAFDETSLAWELYQNEENNISISDTNIRRIEEELKALYDCDVHILPPQKTNISDEDNALAVYSSVFSYIKKGSKIILDITSGFRYMSMLIFQNMQLHSPEIEDGNVTMLYAELGKKISYVRDMTAVWNAAESNKELYNFKTSLNGAQVSKVIRRFNYQKLADWIAEFTDNIQKDYVMSCNREFFARLRNILDSKELKNIEAIKSVYVRETVEFLKKEIVEKFDFKQERLSYYLLVLSSILNERNLFTQAIISLRESFYTRIFEHCKHSQVGKYISEKDLREKNEHNYYPEFLKRCREMNNLTEKALEDLRTLRNSIAHAGEDREKKKLSQDFNTYYKAVCSVFEEIDKGKRFEDMRE